MTTCGRLPRRETELLFEIIREDRSVRSAAGDYVRERRLARHSDP
jgi:hypothetical protein